MQAEQRGQCLILLLCAWAFLTAGPALCVYGAQEKEQNTKAAWEERGFSAHQARQLRHWNIGDTVTRKIDGKSYRFRCMLQLRRIMRIIWAATKVARCFSATR